MWKVAGPATALLWIARCSRRKSTWARSRSKLSRQKRQPRRKLRRPIQNRPFRRRNALQRSHPRQPCNRTTRPSRSSPRSCAKPGARIPDMANGARQIPPPLEVECLKILWKLGEGNVRDVREALTGSRNLAYTTVMTVLDRLSRKGRVARRNVGRSFVYVPVLSREVLRRLAVQDLVDRYFEGSEDSLMDYLRNGEPEEPVAAEESEEALDTTLL